jgi:hypothetical protein
VFLVVISPTALFALMRLPAEYAITDLKYQVIPVSLLVQHLIASSVHRLLSAADALTGSYCQLTARTVCITVESLAV